MTAASMAADENAAAIAGDRLADPSTTRLFLMQPITGSDGSVLLTDGAVIIRRTGTLASRGAQLIIPLAAITDVQLHLGTLSKIYFAYIGGPSNLPSSPSAVMFQRRDSAQFEWLRDAVLERMRTRFLAPVEREATDLSFEPDPGISRLKSELVVINRALSESASDTMKSQGVYGLNRAILKFVTRDTSDHKAELADVARQLEAHIELLEESDKRAADEWTRARANRRQRLQAIVDTLMEESHSRAGDDDLPSVIAPLQSLCHPSFVPTSAAPPRLAALAGECVVAEYKTELIGFEDAGYALNAQLSGGFAGSSGSLSLHGEHLGLSAGAFSG